MVGASLTLVTSRLKAGKEALRLPSETVITILLVIPTSALVGVPVNAPVAVLKLAHDGLLLMLYTSVSASTSPAVGVKLYGLSCATLADGVPLMVGTALATAVQADNATWSELP